MRLTGDAVACGKVNRDPQGSLWESPAGFVTDTLENLGEIETSGVDVDVSYGFDIGNAGKLRFAWSGTYLDKYDDDARGRLQLRLRRPVWRHLHLRHAERCAGGRVAPQGGRDVDDALERIRPVASAGATTASPSATSSTAPTLRCSVTEHRPAAD